MKINVLTTATAILCISLSSIGAEDNTSVDFNASRILSHGTIRSEKEILVKSGSFGIIEEIYVRRGQVVAEGDAIAKVQLIPDYQKLQEARSDLAEQKLHVEYSRSNFDRVQKLYKNKSVSEGTFNEAKLQQDLALSSAKKAEDLIDLILTGKSKYHNDLSNIVRATHKGTILEISQEIGAYITAANSFNSGSTIARLADMDNLIFEGEIPEKYLADIKEGDAIEIELVAFPNHDIGGNIESISYIGIGHEGAVNFKFKASIKNYSTKILRIGLSAIASLPKPNSEALAIAIEH